jgi:Lrp/AsnC family leucine-responsive transcriptional regulator
VKDLVKLDETDRKIISLLAEDSEISQSAIARKLKMSQPAIYTRMKRLRNDGIIARVVGTNLKNTRFYMAKVEMTAKDPWKVLDFFKSCPMYLNGLITSGRRNLCLFFVSEKLQAVESCINHHMRRNPNVVDVEFNVVITPAKDWVVPVKLWNEKMEKSPCGKRCSEQPCYTSEKCLGCPATVFYKGTLL